MANRKYSRQREAIKTLLAGRQDHPTADTVYTCLREEYPNISLGTVYRNLTLLTELGEIIRLSADEGADHFDADTSLHHHFICTKCHNISDVHVQAPDTIIDAAAEHCCGSIDTYRISFYGICDKCAQTQNKTS